MTPTSLGLFYRLAGDPRRHSLEERLFNIISLINGVTNLIGPWSI